jgi:hypothetical protein
MTQRGQNSNCFCTNAAMRRQQGLMISCDTFLCGPQNLAILDPMIWRLHTRVIVPAFDGDEAPGRPRRWLENSVQLPKASPFEQAPVKANKRQ